MKRKIIASLVILLIAIQLVGCSKQNKENENSAQETEHTEESYLYLKDIEVDESVVVGDYKGIEVVKNVVSVTTQDVDAYIEYMMAMSGGTQLEEITDRDTVENGDVANIDYVGKKDGVAFEGGTAQGYDLGIGTGSFIPGFEEGLVGVKKGETVDLNLTFPENYGAADLAGAEVVFTVTVNGIYKEITPQLTDEYVANLGLENMSTVEDYRAYVKEMLEESNQEYALQEVQAQLLERITEGATINNLPEKLVNKFYEININNISYNASMYGMDLESFVSAMYGMDKETFEAQSLEAAQISAKQAMVCLKIAKEENISISDEELNAAAVENYASYNFSSVEEFMNGIDVEEYRDSLLLNKVVDFLVENATITEVPEITE